MRYLLPFFICFLLTTAKAADNTRYVTPASINVLAVSSLAPALTELARHYAGHQNISIIFVFDSPYALAARIENGEAADVFIADHPKWLEALKQKGLIDVYSSHPIGGNRLVLAYPQTTLLRQHMPAMQDVREAMGWLLPRSLFVIGSGEETSFGLYAEQSLKTLGFWNQIKPRVMRASGNQQALLLTAESPAAGILYASDLVGAPELVKIAEFPEDTHDKITYIAAAVAGENMQAARPFIDFLSSPEARRIFKRYGITP